MAANLNDPITLRCGATISNRLAKAATTEGLAGDDANPNRRHARLYGRWADGGAGLVVTGNAMVDRQYLERPGNVVVDEKTDHEALKRWADAGTRAGNHLWMQLNHPGRQCSTDVTDEPVAPSAVRLATSEMFATPRPLDDSEILALIDAWALAASRARDAGFTGVEIHAAHGYLINQFLSPRTNRRTDRWGGSLANRSRFLLSVVQEVRRAVGDDFAVGVKLNASDFQRGGFCHDDAAGVARRLDDAGIDLLEISGGTYERTAFIGDVPDGVDDEPYFLHYAQAIRDNAPGVALMVTGGFRRRAAMEFGLESGDLDIVGAARPFCADPDIPERLLAGELDEFPRPARRLRRHRRGNGTVGAGEKKAVDDWFYHQIERMARGRQPDWPP